jgi:hypothetical protein
MVDNSSNDILADLSLHCYSIFSPIPMRDITIARRLQMLLQQRKGWEMNLLAMKKLPKTLSLPVSMAYDGVIILYLDTNLNIHRIEVLGSEVAFL